MRDMYRHRKRGLEARQDLAKRKTRINIWMGALVVHLSLMWASDVTELFEVDWIIVGVVALAAIALILRDFALALIQDCQHDWDVVIQEIEEKEWERRHG